MYVKNSDKEYQDLGGGVVRKVLAYSDNIMNVELLFEPGAKGEMHAHPHEQIEEGKEDVTLNTGDTYIVGPNVPHGIDCLTKVKLLDIFTPMREDFI